MRTATNSCRFQRLWDWIRKLLSDKTGELRVDKDVPNAKRNEIKIGKTLYIVNSRYNGKENIIDKFKRLIARKLESQSKGN